MLGKVASRLYEDEVPVCWQGCWHASQGQLPVAHDDLVPHNILLLICYMTV